VNSQAKKITELETVYANLKLEKESITTGYGRLSDKHKMVTKKAEQEKMELVKTHATELAKLRGDLDLETRSYTEYGLNVCRRLHKLHKTLASSFDEVKAWCLPFPVRSTKMEEMNDWVAEEVRTVPDTIWQLNDNFTVLVVEGVLNMLNGEGCQELSCLHGLAASSDATALQDVPKDVRKLVGWIIRKCWKTHGLPEALHRLEAANAMTVSVTDS
jgi:hypothetical protein